MERRTVLGSLGALVFSPGCVSDVTESGPETGTTSETEPSPEAETTSETGTTSEAEPSTTTDDCGWPQFCEGSTIVEVIVSPRFSGAVVLETECRDTEFEIRPGETKTITRQVDAETCSIALYVDNQEAYSATVQDYESTTLEINSDGEVYKETVEL